DESHALTINAAGAAYVTGFTSSTDFPSTVCPSASAAGQDVFVAKLGAGGNTLEYSTRVGGAGSDSGHAIALAGASVLVAGETASADFPVTAGAAQTT